MITGAPSNDMDGWVGVLRRQINNILTGLLVIAAIILFIRWRMKTTEMNKLAVGNELASARGLVQRLSNPAGLAGTPADIIKAVTATEAAADASISNVLNSNDSTALLRGQALVLRGDLFWYLANMPQMPGSASEPTLRLNETSDVLLQKSFDAYSEVAKNSTYADQHESLDAAHLGLGAIAENRGDWKTATDEFNAVINDTGSLSVLSDQARVQLAIMPTLQKPLYVAPPSGIAPVIGPMIPTTGLSTTMPTAASMDTVLQRIIPSPTTQPLK